MRRATPSYMFWIRIIRTLILATTTLWSAVGFARPRARRSEVRRANGEVAAHGLDPPDVSTVSGARSHLDDSRDERPQDPPVGIAALLGPLIFR